MRLTILRRFLIRNIKQTENSSSIQTGLSSSVQNNQLAKKINPNELSQIEQVYIKKLNERNLERYNKQKLLRKHYRITGAVLSTIVLSIYFYTMYAINQEKFLDDFDMPEPPDPAANKLKK